MSTTIVSVSWSPRWKNLVTARGRYHSCNHSTHPLTNWSGPYCQRTTEGVQLVSTFNLHVDWKNQGHRAKTLTYKEKYYFAGKLKHWLLLLLTRYCSCCCYKTIHIWTFHHISFELINCKKFTNIYTSLSCWNYSRKINTEGKLALLFVIVGFWFSFAV